MLLRDLEIAENYSSREGMDLINEFYNPVLETAIEYDRVTGFFSPKVLAAAARGFAQLIQNGGKIRLVTSIEVAPEVIKSYYDSVISEEVLERYAGWNAEEIEGKIDEDYLGVFSYLLASGQLEMKIALTEDGDGILHQKIGIIIDAEGDAISFSGSNNETVRGWQNNIEEFKVFRKHELASYKWFMSDAENFERLWENKMPGVRVLPLSLAAKEKLIKITESKDEIGKVVERIKKYEDPKKRDENAKTKPKELFDYQKAAIQFWFDHDCNAIFEMATGTGKTFTTIQALKKFQEEHGGIHAIVAAPLASLVVQWREELVDNIKDCSIVTTDSMDWRKRVQEIISLQELGSNQSFIIVTTYSLFNRKDFQEKLQRMRSELILVADEMHNLVTGAGIKSASLEIFRYRLGLSATPERLWEPKKSEALAKIFHEARFSFTLADAIERGFLVPFDYYPIPTHLNNDETQEYLDLSAKIGPMMAANGGVLHEDSDDESLKSLLIRRARIKKEAQQKMKKLREILVKLRSENKLDHALIYVDNEEYLSELQKMLNEEKIITARIIGETNRKEREEVVRALENGAIDAIVAIKCLDEGVDIPSAQRAFILSSNTDPREYVQRLGRVLRVDRKYSRKKFAEIYDFIVLPPENINFRDESDYNAMRGMVKWEATRAKFFTSFARNGDDASFELFEMAHDYGMVFSDYELCYNGYEGLEE